MEQEIKKRLKLFSYFENWQEEAIQQVCRMAKILTYQPDDIIFGGKKYYQTYVYFITRGSCRIMEYLLSDKKKKMDFNNNNQKGQMIDIYVMNRLACFNIGESLKNKIIVAREQTECLLIPHFWLSDHNPFNIWPRISYFLNFNLPTRDQYAKIYKEKRVWNQYKATLIRGKIQRKFMCNNYHNIPYTLRVDSLTHELD